MPRPSTSTIPTIFVLAAAAVALSASPAAADRAWSYTGSTLGAAPTFDRPVDAGPAQLGQLVHYHEQRILITAPAECEVISSQDYDGYLHVYEGVFDPISPVGPELIGGNDDFPTFGIVGQSRVQFTAGAGTYIIVTSDYSSSRRGSFHNYVQCEDDQGAEILLGSCPFYVFGVPIENQVCLDDGFAVAIDGVSNSSSGLGVPVGMSSRNSAFFWFYNDRNFEVVVKVLDACSFPVGSPVRGYWVLAAALTNQSYRIRVRAPNGVERTVTANSFPTQAPAFLGVPEFDESFCQ